MNIKESPPTEDKSFSFYQQKLIALIEQAGSDYKAIGLIEKECGSAPDRSSLVRLRNGQGKQSTICMVTYILERALKQPI